MNNPEYLRRPRINHPSDVDNRIFSALLAIWIGLAINRQITTIEQIIKLLFWLTFISFWLKISISGRGKFVARIFVYITTIVVAYGLGSNIYGAFTKSYTDNELALLRFMFPLIIFFWIVASEINRWNWRRAIAEHISFGDGW